MCNNGAHKLIVATVHCVVWEHYTYVRTAYSRTNQHTTRFITAQSKKATSQGATRRMRSGRSSHGGNMKRTLTKHHQNALYCLNSFVAKRSVHLILCSRFRARAIRVRCTYLGGLNTEATGIRIPSKAAAQLPFGKTIKHEMACFCLEL